MLNVVKPVLLLALLSFQQPVKHKSHQKLREPHPMRSNEPYIDDCVFTNKYTLQQRLKKYPFNKAVKIEAVSYRAHLSDPNVLIWVKGKLRPVVQPRPAEGLLIKNQHLNRIDIKESVLLTSKQISTLSNLIFNTDYRTQDQNRADPGNECMFEPRNALIFYDAKGKIFDYLEVCFHCEDYQSKSGKFSLGANCNQRYDLTKKFFLDLGIKYGIINTNPLD